MTDKITSWPPVIAEWVSGRGYDLLIGSNGCSVKVSRPGEVNGGWLLMQPGVFCSSWLYDDTSADGHALERIDAVSRVDAAITGFNRLIELGIIKRRPPLVPVDCDGPVDDAPTFPDNLE